MAVQSRLLYTHAVRHACCCRHAGDASALEAASPRHSADGSAASAQLDADPDLEAYLKVSVDCRLQRLSCWAHALA